MCQCKIDLRILFANLIEQALAKQFLELALKKYELSEMYTKCLCNKNVRAELLF